MGDEAVVASLNASKVREIREILSGASVDLLSAADLGWVGVEETGSTYRENASLKAASVAGFSGRAALADDSGIEVDVLGGLPGVRSARLAGRGADDERNNVRLISLLHGVPMERRTARYRCVVVLRLPDGEEIDAEATCEGSIALKPAGSGGFGYDPWFIPEGMDITMAELPPESKHAISHRGKALRALALKLGWM